MNSGCRARTVPAPRQRRGRGAWRGQQSFAKHAVLLSPSVYACSSVNSNMKSNSNTACSSHFDLYEHTLIANSISTIAPHSQWCIETPGLDAAVLLVLRPSLCFWAAAPSRRLDT